MKEKKVLWDSKDVSLMELADLPVRGNEVVPINQHTAVDPELADLLGTRVCGPSCAAMALQVFGKYPQGKPLGNVEWLLADVSKMHKSNGKVIKFRVNLDGQEIKLSVDVYSDANKDLLSDPRYIVVDEKDEYQPVFSMVRGWDHRGSSGFFGSFGLQAGYWEKFNFNDLITKLSEGGVLILSVVPRRLSATFHFKGEVGSKPAHLVLVTDVLQINGRDYFLVIDPDYDISEGVMPRYLLDKEQFSGISNWRGSWIMGRQG